MKKNITKAQIISTTLEIMRNRTDLNSVNLREIARTLGCAHTNLYNYFPSYSDLLWEVHAVLMEDIVDIVRLRLRPVESPEQRFKVFFKTFLDIYLDNKGWFKLAWHEYMGESQPVRDADAMELWATDLGRMLKNIWKEISGQERDIDTVRKILHSTHCYIVGEVSNFLLGRGMKGQEERFKVHVTNEAIKIFSLCMIEE